MPVCLKLFFFPFHFLVEYYSRCSPLTSSSFTSQQTAAPISPLQKLFLSTSLVCGWFSISLSVEVTTTKMNISKLQRQRQHRWKKRKEKGRRKETMVNGVITAQPGRVSFHLCDHSVLPLGSVFLLPTNSSSQSMATFPYSSSALPLATHVGCCAELVLLIIQDFVCQEVLRNPA